MIEMQYIGVYLVEKNNKCCIDIMKNTNNLRHKKEVEMDGVNTKF